MRAKPLEMLYLEIGTLKRSTIVEILPSGEIVVRLSEANGEIFVCDFLETSTNGHPDFQEGDRVLVLPPDDLKEKGCVLGKISAYRKPNRKQVVLEADEELTIRCGKGSITIRKTGNILVKGLEIVSHAKGANRIRGASIQLN